ncbi:2-amino-4-hydroxy-6-hydroxymethyldihydropteridine diphosphokinase [Aerococcus urinaeequi]|uniref:2-amino-4-hydroxy-6-hydroxymethyldihydropteridine diphosphokinase n=1 Tax=Aerococcus viridans TaxID=1377 RepID=A0A2N6UD53_9LACT|nr:MULTISPECIES: 2-amino-4-hydroxy-6-hydroxymethyldihydropteridine diphosphokinase [Aerococcus]OFU52451.1 2-amino-4-hydroxy-6-hydroxymethyldihydropteridine pyrophosphokinase [Aerococcus sp. HMSC10H05]PMC79486.1 2-amino-4-hydroxy-6-hydroxymethyldihydropteridine diphosphokinase [Aerococcus viridans]
MQRDILIALGSNIAPKLDHLKNAVAAFKQHESMVVKSISPIYETVPKGYLDQEDFLNMVIHIQTDLDEDSLLVFCQKIEQDQKRVRTIKNGPRTIDVDILLIDEEIIDTPDLQVPHPRMHERAFVLCPAADIVGSWQVPILGQSVVSLRDQLPQAERDDVRISGFRLAQ